MSADERVTLSDDDLRELFAIFSSLTDDELHQAFAADA